MLIGDQEVGRLKMMLDKESFPRTAENFRELCTGEKGQGMSGRPLSFKNSKFFIVKPRYYCCGGDIVENDGTCGESIYGADFKSEKRNNFIGRGDLAMGCIDGVHSSQFFITFGNNFGLDGKYPVFGRVVKGWDVLAKIEAAADGDGHLEKDVLISACGQIN
ncbi:hypothetical protein Tsubulata_029618 [Turnera subulata]|uniref:Peptidyl-prolyl cis-trans isomerase n=1 Tax=Turnera subulata TaxID=218843 RepID=A0A9Q0FRE3_9ROSI|nr:hypothetical protein Tsubulata_029618 [Turnera subulata]